MDKIKECLKNKMTPEDMEILMKITKSLEGNPFAYNPDTNGFEICDRWLTIHGDKLSDDEVDLILSACRVLDDGINDDARSKLVDPDSECKGKYEKKYDFYEHSGDVLQDTIAVGKKFVSLLRENPCYRVITRERNGNYRVKIEFDFLSELDYQRKKDHTQWLLGVARRLVKGKPYEGRNLT